MESLLTSSRIEPKLFFPASLFFVLYFFFHFQTCGRCNKQSTWREAKTRNAVQQNVNSCVMHVSIVLDWTALLQSSLRKYTLPVKSLEAPDGFNVVSFILMSIDSAVSQ